MIKLLGQMVLFRGEIIMVMIFFFTNVGDIGCTNATFQTLIHKKPGVVDITDF